MDRVQSTSPPPPSAVLEGATRCLLSLTRALGKYLGTKGVCYKYLLQWTCNPSLKEKACKAKARYQALQTFEVQFQKPVLERCVPCPELPGPLPLLDGWGEGAAESHEPLTTPIPASQPQWQPRL